MAGHDQGKRCGVAHDDLQHANTMIDDKNEIKLVDYDGMCVPGIAGRQNEEIGVEPYQHRDETVIQNYILV